MKLTSLWILPLAMSSPSLAAEPLDTLFAQLGSPGAEARGKARQVFQNICFRAARPGAEADRVALCTRIVSRLTLETPNPARVWFLRQLEQIGREEVVAGLDQLLRDKDPRIREGARRALEHNPSAKAIEKLQSALARAETPEWRLAIINSLGRRRDRASVGSLIRHVRSTDTAVAAAAASALGAIGGRKAAGVLSAVRKAATAAIRPALTDAYLQCAERFVDEGKTADAARIYEELYKPSAPPHIRAAALRGLKAVQRRKAGLHGR